MRKLMILLGVLAFTACAPTAQIVHQNGKTTREAIVYDDHVVIVSKTVITKEQFKEVMDKRTRAIAENGKN